MVIFVAHAMNPINIIKHLWLIRFGILKINLKNRLLRHVNKQNYYSEYMFNSVFAVND